METAQPEQQPQTALANISRHIVQLHKQYYGRGPTGAKTYFAEDVVVVLMHGGFTTVEETLLEQGRGEAVIAQRMQFQEVMREKFSEVVEQELGRRVVAFMSGSHQQPDLLVETFVLQPQGSELLADAHAGDPGDETKDSQPS